MASLSLCLVTLPSVMLVASLGLSSCGSAEPTPETEVAPVVPAPPASTEPIAPPAHEGDLPHATRLPDSCLELLPALVLQAIEPRLEMFDTSADVVIQRMQIETGPLTMATLLGGEQQLYCSFGIRQTDGGGNIGVAIISEQKKTELLDALRSSVYEEVAPGNADAAFVQRASADHRYTEEILIDADVLIAVPHTIGGDFAWDALTEIQAQNS